MTFIKLYLFGFLFDRRTLSALLKTLFKARTAKSYFVSLTVIDDGQYPRRTRGSRNRSHMKPPSPDDIEVIVVSEVSNTGSMIVE